MGSMGEALKETIETTLGFLIDFKVPTPNPTP
jgi:hypothetical protein